MPAITGDTAAKLKASRLCDRVSAVEQLTLDLLVQRLLDVPVQENLEEVQQIAEAKLLQEVERSRLTASRSNPPDLEGIPKPTA